jgi:hypothetical protein
MSETCTWLCGMLIAYEIQNHTLFRTNEKRLLIAYDLYKKKMKGYQWEVLYGIPGFLYTFLELQK